MFYPPKVFTDETRFPELEKLHFFKKETARSSLFISINNEDELNSLIRIIIKSKATRKVVQRLMAIDGNQIEPTKLEAGH